MMIRCNCVKFKGCPIFKKAKSFHDSLYNGYFGLGVRNDGEMVLSEIVLSEYIKDYCYHKEKPKMKTFLIPLGFTNTLCCHLNGRLGHEEIEVEFEYKNALYQFLHNGCDKCEEEYINKIKRLVDDKTIELIEFK